ncbi:MAG: acyl-CoA thioesterase [Aestuariibacter sp.]
MLSETFKVRFSETDGLGHVGNTVHVVWFEAAREPIFKLFTPGLDMDSWPLILASYKVDFLKQVFLGEVEIRSGISRLGGSSFDIYQEVWQNEECCAKGVTTLVNFDYQQNKAQPIPEDVRRQLQELAIELES